MAKSRVFLHGNRMLQRLTCLAWNVAKYDLSCMEWCKVWLVLHGMVQSMTCLAWNGAKYDLSYMVPPIKHLWTVYSCSLTWSRWRSTVLQDWQDSTVRSISDSPDSWEMAGNDGCGQTAANWECQQWQGITSRVLTFHCQTHSCVTTPHLHLLHHDHPDTSWWLSMPLANYPYIFDQSFWHVTGCLDL